MKIYCTFYLLVFGMLNQSAFCQSPEVKKLTIIKKEKLYERVKIDTSHFEQESVFIIQEDQWSLWSDHGQLPILHNDFDPDRIIKSDSLITKVKNNKGNVKRFAFNDVKNDWFLFVKIRRFKARRVTKWVTFYHEYHETYFTIKISFKFDRHGRLISERSYNKNSKQVEWEKHYFYE